MTTCGEGIFANPGTAPTHLHFCSYYSSSCSCSSFSFSFSYSSSCFCCCCCCCCSCSCSNSSSCCYSYSCSCSCVCVCVCVCVPGACLYDDVVLRPPPLDLEWVVGRRGLEDHDHDDARLRFRRPQLRRRPSSSSRPVKSTASAAGSVRSIDISTDTGRLAVTVTEYVSAGKSKAALSVELLTLALHSYSYGPIP